MKSLFKSILSVRPLVGGVLLSVLAFCDLAVAADSPTYIPFQGQVTNQGGTVVADGQYSIIFNLYDQAVGGQPVWSERHVKVGVTRGTVTRGESQAHVLGADGPGTG